MELGEIRIRLKDIQEVERQIEALFELVSSTSRNGLEEGLVLEHELHVLMREAQEQQGLGSLDFLFDVVFVEELDVLISQLYGNLAEIDLVLLSSLLNIQELSTG